MFKHVTLIGLGLIGSSLAHAVKRRNLAERITGYDISESVRKRAAEIELAAIASDLAEAVKDSDLVILCSPVGSYKELAAAIAPHLKPGAILSDVGSVKSAVIRDVAPALPKGVHSFPPTPSPAPSNPAPMRVSPACSIIAGASSRLCPAPMLGRSRSSSNFGKHAAARSR